MNRNARDDGPAAGAEPVRFAHSSEEEFARRLVQGAADEAVSRWMALREGRHTLLGDLEVGLDPLIRFVQPHPPIPFLTGLFGVGGREKSILDHGCRPANWLSRRRRSLCQPAPPPRPRIR